MQDNNQISKILLQIDKQHLELKGIVNTTTFYFYWKLGEIFDTHLDNNFKATNENIFDSIRKSYPEYESLFLYENIKKFVQFFRFIPDQDAASHFGFFITWENISYVLNLSYTSRQLYFLVISIRDSLSYASLKNLIDADTIKLNRGEIDYHQKLSELLLLNNPNGNKIKNALDVMPCLLEMSDYDFYNSPTNISIKTFNHFKLLLQPIKNKDSATENLIYQNQTKNLINLIDSELSIFKKVQNKRINFSLNRMQWDFGDSISLLLAERAINENEYLASITDLLSEKYGDLFTKKTITSALRFKKNFQNFIDAARIAKLVTWDHIIILLDLPKIEEMLYFSRIAAHDGLSVPHLKELIQFTKTPSFLLDIEADAISGMETEISSEKTDSNNVIIHTKYYDLGNDIEKSLLCNDLISVKDSPFLKLLIDNLDKFDDI